MSIIKDPSSIDRADQFFKMRKLTSRSRTRAAFRLSEAAMFLEPVHLSQLIAAFLNVANA